MEESWENFNLHMELDYNCDTINIDDGDDFLREILLETPQTGENDSVNCDVEVVNNMIKSDCSDSVVSEQQEEHGQSKNVGGPCCLPKTFILSFDNSTVIPAATPQPCVNSEAKRDSKNKRSRESNEKMKRNEEKVVKKSRSRFQCADHIIAERKRRQELTERFIALSATIPGLSKTDKASILRAAIDYVKNLQERVHELEKQNNNIGVTSMMVLNNSDETSTDDDYDCNKNTTPEIEARVMGKEVLIEIHCEKQIGIELKVLKHVENLELFVTGSSVLPFGKSDISITIIARMGGGYKVRVDDLVKSLRRVILKSEMGCESDLF
ncbi:unnamed protein product [Lathyrus sativus]|nr:unnamed protein product [Lathyrus sativus]